MSYKDFFKNEKKWFWDVNLKIDKTGKVLSYVCEDSDEKLDDIQRMVDVLVNKKLLTPSKKSKNYDISIVIWVIDETNDLYIEVYHNFENGVSKGDSVTLFNQEFLNEIMI